MIYKVTLKLDNFDRNIFFFLSFEKKFQEVWIIDTNVVIYSEFVSVNKHDL